MPRVWPLVLGLVGGCFTQTTTQPDPPTYPPDYPPDYYPDGGSYTPPGGGGGYYGYCHVDSDCGGTGDASIVCARDGECLAASAVRVIHVTWTVHGQAASTTSCANAPALELAFADQYGSGQFGFAPVPCQEGKFTIDKMPKVYTNVLMGAEYDYGSGGASGVFDATGTVALDLPY